MQEGKSVNRPDAALSGSYSIGGDMPINRLGFGAMRITGPGIWGMPERLDEAVQLLTMLFELNINFIDTADSYGPEISEQLIAETLYPYPEDLVIATKGGLTRQGPNQWAPVGRPEYIHQCLELSLRRLRVDTIDLYQLHRFDPQVPWEDTLGKLKELQEQGKIRHIGLSEVTVQEIESAQKIVNVASVQNLYNITNRKSEEVLNYCEQHDIAFIPWFPVAAGDLAKPGNAIADAANSRGITASQLALAWLLRRSRVMVPIPGTSSISHLLENTAATMVDIPEEDWRDLEQLAAAMQS